jgi:hypothetical protein
MIALQKTTDNAEGAVEDVCAKFMAQCKGTALKHFCFLLVNGRVPSLTRL